MRILIRCFLLALLASLVSCGGGSSDSNNADNSSQARLLSSGFSDEGIFSGQVNSASVLLVLSNGEFFLLADDVAGKGNYDVHSVTLTGEGMAYRVSDSGQRDGDMQISGTYKTDRHLELAWRMTSTGEESTLLMEATSAYFVESNLDKTVGGWINQDESNLVFFIVHENYNPVAADDLAATDPGTPVTIDVLANDGDPDGDTLTIVGIEGDAPPLGGGAAVDDRGTEDAADDVIVYTPTAATTSGVDEFKYRVNDGNDGEDTAKVRVTIPGTSTDLAVDLAVDNDSPAVGEFVQFTVSVANLGEADEEMQVRFPLPSGYRFLSDRSGGDYDVEGGFWQTHVAAGETAELLVQAAVEEKGDYRLHAALTGLTGTDYNDANDTASLVLAPGGGTQQDDPGPGPQGDAQLEGFVLSTLTQIRGSIGADPDGHNAYPLNIRFGAGFGGNAAAEAQSGFAIINDETVDDELRPAMLILTANGNSVYINKLYWVSEDEIGGQAGNAGSAQPSPQ